MEPSGIVTEKLKKSEKLMKYLTQIDKMAKTDLLIMTSETKMKVNQRYVMAGLATVFFIFWFDVPRKVMRKSE